MLEMYDQLLEFSSEELEDWAREHALSNMALQSNIIYDKVLKEIGESYKYNFEEDTPMPSGLAKQILEKLHIATHWLKTKRPTAYIDIPTLQYEFINEHNLQINR